MKGFPGFPAGRVRFTPIPDLFFSELVPTIDDLAEMKVVLHLFWLLYHKKGYPRYVSRRELAGDVVLMSGLRGLELPPAEALDAALERAVARGVLLRVRVRHDETEDDCYFVNTDSGRQTVEKLVRGELHLEIVAPPEQARVEVERPNIFVLYERNIGLLQPMIAEELQEAEQTYPQSWIEEAFRIAAEHNVRRWAYVRSVLERWAREGKDDEKGEQDRRRYIEGKYADYVEH